MSLFTTLEEYAVEILDAVRARSQQLEQAFGASSPELAHIVSTLEAHVVATTPVEAPVAPVVEEPVTVVEEPVEVAPAEEALVAEAPAEVSEDK